MASEDYLPYHEPKLVQLLTLVSFFLFLSAADWLSARFLKAGLIGQIAVGVIYGQPVGGILPLEWQETFVSLGYVGLILIIFEGGLTVRLDLLRKNFWLSLLAACIGVAMPIALCYLILFLGFGHGAIETFIIGAALSTTSLGTTFVVLGTAADGIDFGHTKVGVILISAAVLDDISGLVMASITGRLGALASGASIGIPWLIMHPVIASLSMAVLSPAFATLLFGPLFRRHVEHRLPSLGHAGNVVLLAAVLCAFLAISSTSGASVLFGAFLAGTFLGSLPCTHPDGPFVGNAAAAADATEQPGGNPDAPVARAPKFIDTFELFLGGTQKNILQPLFFASMGFAIPFKRLWSGQAIWRGVVFSLAMVAGKLSVGLFIPLWDTCTRRPRLPTATLIRLTFKPALLLGMSMVPRGEIGLLIVQIGLNETPFLSQDAFVTAVWAIVLNTIVGPVAVGLLMRSYGHETSDDTRWGRQDFPTTEGREPEWSSIGWWKKWTSRKYTAAVITRGSSMVGGTDPERNCDPNHHDKPC